MKYVVLAPKPTVTDITRVVCFCMPTLHEEIAQKFALTHQPVSAGFLEILASGDVEVFGYSTTLRMGPLPGDANLIKSFIKGTIAMGRKSIAYAPSAA